MTEFHIPCWVLLPSYLTIALGRLAGGWRIVQTMGYKLTHLDTRAGFSAESGAALTIMLATLLKLPVSTTHATAGAILGAGIGKHERKHFRTRQRILIASPLTIPARGRVDGVLV